MNGTLIYPTILAVGLPLAVLVERWAARLTPQPEQEQTP